MNLETIEEFKISDIVNSIMNHEHAIILTRIKDVDVIDNDDCASSASSLLKLITSLLKTIEEKRKSTVAPYNNYVSNVNKKVKEFIKSLEETKSDITKKLRQLESYQAELIRKQRIEDAKKQELPTGQGTVDFTALKAVKPDSQEQPKKYVQTRKHWTFEVERLSLVPRSYLNIDTKKVNEFIRKGGRQIPGIKIFQKNSGE